MCVFMWTMNKKERKIKNQSNQCPFSRLNGIQLRNYYYIRYTIYSYINICLIISIKFQ